MLRRPINQLVAQGIMPREYILSSLIGDTGLAVSAEANAGINVPVDGTWQRPCGNG
jgi:hypothetical protein